MPSSSTDVVGLDGVINIKGHSDHFCALTNSKVLKCWGLNTNGQLAKGNKTTLGDGAGEMAALTNINLGTSVLGSSMASASYSTCVIATNKRIKCFGAASSGQLLNGMSSGGIGDSAGEVGDGIPWVNH
jgi:alpha-tubulin suppressor-like RCC1 family protein